MTKQQTKQAMETQTKVEAGKPGTDEYDVGIILAINGDYATVAWDQGVRTPCLIADLRVAR